jgi:hypothetical protein
MAAGDFTMTALLPSLFAAARTVSKERCGTLDAIDLNFDSKGAAVGDTVNVPYTAANTPTDFTPAAYAPLGAAATASTIQVAISASKKDSWSVSDEQESSLMNGGNAQTWLQLKTANAMRAVRNIADVAANTAAVAGAARACGTVGTTPFGSDLSALVAARRILVDIGAPTTDLQCVCSGAAYDNMLGLGVVQQASLSGDTNERRSGTIRQQLGFNIREDAWIASHTAGTGAATYQVNATTVAAGATSMVVKTGSGTIIAGDFGTIGTSDTNIYGFGGGVAAAADTLLINRPGLVTAKSANDYITLKAAYIPTLCFDRSSIVGIVRPPKLNGDGSVIKTQIVTDENGLTYLFVRSIQYGVTTYEIHLAYGFKVVNEHVAVIFG